jgi:hypothetical protein
MPWGERRFEAGAHAATRIVTRGVRNMMDNGGLSAGPQIVLKQGMITPADGNWQMTPRKVWYAPRMPTSTTSRRRWTFFEIPSRQVELMEIIQFGMKLMEDARPGLPMLLQGSKARPRTPWAA